MIYKVELMFDIKETGHSPSVYMFGYYLERNMYSIINTIFEDYEIDGTPKNLGFVPDEIMIYRVKNVEELKEW